VTLLNRRIWIWYCGDIAKPTDWLSVSMPREKTNHKYIVAYS